MFSDVTSSLYSRMALIRALPVWLKGGKEMECDGSEIFCAVTTSVVDDCQLRLVNDYSMSQKSEVMNIMNTCQCIHLLTLDGVRRSLRLPTPLSPVGANGAEAMLRCFCSWQVLSVASLVFLNPMLQRMCFVLFYLCFICFID
jgi:hypothetical protein